MKLRDYQQDAVNAAIAHMKKSTEPSLLELATGAGKSLIVAAIAQWVHEFGKKKVLCLQPSKELTEQNYSKYIATGNKASIFSASTGSKCTRYPVVYATPQSVANSISRFGDAFGAIIIDEAHEITPTIKEIIAHIQSKNDRVRVIGMTATPYRMNSGYIYGYDETDNKKIVMGDDKAVNPYFHNLIYRITTRELIDMGFLTNAHADPTISEHQYHSEGLKLNNRGQFNAKDIESVFEGQGRLTASIVADVVAHSHDRRGVMLFAATVQHAKEILDSLPPHNSRMIGGEVNMKKAERETLINDFKQQRFKYIVSVGTLTTGFDAPHVDVVAVLRATESASLFQQIIGRGLRLYDNKADCLVLDYANNIERHGLQKDLFTPDIKAYKKKESAVLSVDCPLCGIANEFSARPNTDNLKIDKDGYFLDLAGNRISLGDGVYLPAHFGRRCNGYFISRMGKAERCEYRWASKECPECGHENDIAARYCENDKCKAELVNPNDKLNSTFATVYADPHALRTERVIDFRPKKSVSKAGNDVLIIDIVTDKNSFRVWYNYNPESKIIMNKWSRLLKSTIPAADRIDYDPTDANFSPIYFYMRRCLKPKTISYRKQRDTDFYDVVDYNRQVTQDLFKSAKA